MIGASEREEGEKRAENLLEGIMAENFPNLVKKIDIQVWKHRNSQTKWTQRDPQQDITEMAKVKGKI